MHDGLSPGRIVRRVFGTASIVFGLAGLFLARGDTRVLAAAAAFGILALSWDLVMHWLVEPLIGLGGDMLHGGGIGGNRLSARPTLNETIRFLERLFEGEGNPDARIQAGLRLEEIWRTVKKDQKKADDILRRLATEFPDRDAVRNRLFELT